MPDYTVALTGMQATGQYVQDDHFATNALQWVNVDAHGHIGPTDGFESAADELGLTHFRYPGGGTENVIDITRLENGQLRSEVRTFLDWVVERSTPEAPGKVTMVLPTKVFLPAERIENFVYLLLEEYGDIIEALEIGNEYSIGRRVEGFDRSIHPEENPDGDFMSSMTETEYGQSANRVIEAALDGIERLAQDQPGNAHDPKILLQIAETNGAGSDYKGNEGNWRMANEAILEWLSTRSKEAVDGGVAHYYYNQSHRDDEAFAHSWQERRSLDERILDFNEVLGHDVELYITEWNVLASNYNQLGAASASILLEMFESMVQWGVEDAHIWPLQHRTGSNIAGNRQVDEMELTMGGAAFRMMAESLRSQTSETGHVSAYESIRTDSTGSGGVVEANLYSSAYQDVIFVSLRDLARSEVSFDISPLLDTALSVQVMQLTIDQSTQDALSDMADPEGGSRIGRRIIDTEEYAQLSALPFFEPDNKNHVKDLGDGRYATYLPTFDSIIPLVANPQSIEDFYFATETDVAPLLTALTGDFLGTGRVDLEMMPYDVVQIVIESEFVQEDGWEDGTLLGGVGVDVMLGRGGNDTLISGEAADTLKGGHGDDLLQAGSGDDYLVDGGGNDTLQGGSGDDVMVVSLGDNLVEGGAGRDILRLSVNRDEVSVRVEGSGLVISGANFTATATSVEVLEFADQQEDAQGYFGEVMLGGGIAASGDSGSASGPVVLPETGDGDAFVFAAVDEISVQDAPVVLIDTEGATSASGFTPDVMALPPALLSAMEALAAEPEVARVMEFPPDML